MKFVPTEIPGAFVIEPERHEDERGFFARTWCANEFAAQGLETRLAQCSISFSAKKGTLRGMHYQAAPYGEVKIVRCTMGAIFDVIIDLRRDSPAFTRHVSVVLSADNRKMLYVPRGCAHGLQTLEDNTEVFYQMSEFYAPEHSRGVRWNDPAFGIAWPDDERTILERDQSYPNFVP